MIPKVTKGKGAVKLAVYLAGPGHANEHSEQHVIAASESMVSVEAGQFLDHSSAIGMGIELDRPHKLFEKDSTRQSIWHVSLSMDAASGVKDDSWWEDVAREFMTRMGFEGVDSEEFRWVAVRHGVSAAGNDHIHIAASMVSESGSRWSDRNDWRKAQAVCREIEQAKGLQVLGQGVKTQGYARGELESLARRRAFALHTRQCDLDPSMTPWKFLDKVSREQLIAAQIPEVQPRHELAVAVRAATAGSRSEAEFVRRARSNGLIVRPRFAKGSQEEVVGYSVAMRPLHGEDPIWYGGNTLGRDLSLPAMRAGWPDEDKDAALAEWRAAQRNKPLAGAELSEPSGVELAEYFKEMSDYLRTVGTVPVGDPVEYARMCREGAGLLSSWAVAAGREGDAAAAQLRQSAQIFARHAELAEGPHRAVSEPSKIYSDLCTHIAISKSRRAGAVAVIRAWANMGSEIGKGFKAHGWATGSEAFVKDLRAHLDHVHDTYRELNPLTPRAQASAGVAVAERKPAQRAAQVSTTVDRAEKLKALEERLRAEGLPEKSIQARLFSEQQQAGSPLDRKGSFHRISRHVQADPKQGKSQRQDKGREL